MNLFLHRLSRIRIVHGDLEWSGTPAEFATLEPGYPGLPAGMITRYATPEYQYVSDGDEQYVDIENVLQYCANVASYPPGSGDPASIINDAATATDSTWSSNKIAVEIASGGGAGGVGYVGEVRFGFWIASPDPDNWILCAGTIGNAASGADYAGSQYQALFEHLYASLSDAYAPVSSGRSGGAAADFNAGKTLTLPDFRGRAPIGAGQGSGLTLRELGSAVGEEAHSLTASERPADTPKNSAYYNGGAVVHGSYWYANGVHTNVGYANNADSIWGSPHNNMPPSLAVLAIIKY